MWATRHAREAKRSNSESGHASRRKREYYKTLRPHTYKMSVLIGPISKFSEYVGTDLTYRHKFNGLSCCEGGDAFKSTDEYFWHCRNPDCKAISHIRCIRKRMRQQADTSSPAFGCKVCFQRLTQDDIAKIKDLSYDEQSAQIDDLQNKVEELARMIETVIISNEVLKSDVKTLQNNYIILKEENMQLKEENSVAKAMIEQLVKRL